MPSGIYNRTEKHKQLLVDAKKGIYNKKAPKECIVCHKKFIPTRSVYQTCSRKCGCKLRKGKTAFSQMETECSYCHNKFITIPSKLKNRKYKYCSESCYYRHKKEIVKGENNSNYKGGISKYVRHCLKCKKEFTTNYNSKQKYCSRRCVVGINSLDKGKTYEKKAMRELRQDGYFVVHSAGSKTHTDLIAINNKEIRLIQIKSTRCKNLNPFTICKHEIESMRSLKTPNNVKKEIWIWYARKGWRKEIL